MTLLLALCLAAPAVRAWGPVGHRAIGVIAVEMMRPDTRAVLASIIGDDDAVVAERCTWPDWLRDEGGGEWSAPLHYVNIDVEADRYQRSRDCPNDACVTEAVNRFAAELGDETRAPDQRSDAFAFLCHFTADLHQPLHVAYAEDQGGNRYRLQWDGEDSNLHSFWDQHVIQRHASDWPTLATALRDRRHPHAPAGWQPADTRLWTNETFTLMRWFAYPDGSIDAEFETRSWNVARQQMDMAALRLAAILDTVLAGQSEVARDAEPDDGAAEVLASEEPGG